VADGRVADERLAGGTRVGASSDISMRREMKFRRVAITLAGIVAAAFMTAGPAAACGDGGFGGKGSASAGFSYENIGGPYGITHAHGGFKKSVSYFGGSDALKP
jgi:hypothetical protein